MWRNRAKSLILGGSVSVVNSAHRIDVARKPDGSGVAGGGKTARFGAVFRKILKKEGRKRIF
jgi:hypothetical protein